LVSPKEVALADRDSAPSHTLKPIDPAPPSDHPTTPMLKADIDSGQTGDKIGLFDPGLSPLGTDDEAAGRPPSPFRIALARHLESAERWMRAGRKTGDVHQPPDMALTGFVGFIMAVAVIFVAGLSFF
jgi:hypothetical protein